MALIFFRLGRFESPVVDSAVSVTGAALAELDLDELPGSDAGWQPAHAAIQITVVPIKTTAANH